MKELLKEAFREATRLVFRSRWGHFLIAAGLLSPLFWVIPMVWISRNFGFSFLELSVFVVGGIVGQAVLVTLLGFVASFLYAVATNWWKRSTGRL